MRFLGIMSNGNGVMSGSMSLGLGMVGSLNRAGEILTGLPSVCPASMLQASNGTLLVASGLGPMYRMRHNERDLYPAGVPAPNTPLTILGTDDYSNELSGNTDPLTGRQLRTITFDFTIYGSVLGPYSRQSLIIGGTIGKIDYTENGLASSKARGALYQQYASMIAAQSASELTNGVANSNAKNRLKSLLGGWKAVASGEGQYSAVWLRMSGSFNVYDDDGEGAENSITGGYQAFQRWVDKDGYVSDPGPLSAVVQVADRNLIKYTEVEVPADTRVAKRQIWRNNTGQLQNFYLDVETNDLTSTTFESRKTDSQLVLSDVITFTDVDGYTIPYLYAQPPTDKPFLAELRGRIFAVGSRRYSTGSCQVTNGSATVTGIGTSWTNAMAGRRFIAGKLEYLIQNVDESAQTLTLAATYAGVTDPLALYVIAPYAAEELVVRWSDPTAGPESWPLTAQLLLPQDGDTITGIVNYGDALYITKTRNIYRLNFTEDPAVDGEVSPAAKRGCINHRCAVSVEGACFMMDREGIHAFVGGPAPTHVTIPIADIFREETDGYRINWEADLCMFHAVLHQEIGCIKWYVALAGDMFPQHAICYDYRRQRLWLESYPRPICSSCYSLAITGRPLLGTTEGKILAADTGSLDLIQPGGTLFTVASVNSPFSLTLDFVPKDCEGVPFVIVNGAAAGTDRVVSSQSSTEIQFITPLAILPAVGDKIQIGGIPYRVKTAIFDAAGQDGNAPSSFSMKVNPNQSNLYGALTIYKDGRNIAKTNVAARATWGAASKNPTASTKQTFFDAATERGMIVENLSRPDEADKVDVFQWQFQVDGSSGETKPRILEIRVDGAG